MKKYVIGLLFILLLTFTAAICTASEVKKVPKLATFDIPEEWTVKIVQPTRTTPGYVVWPQIP